MEFPFDLSVSLKLLPIERIDRQALKWINLRRNPGLQKAIDEIGRLAAKVQNLKRPITTFDKFADSEDEQAIYLLWKKSETNSNKSIVMGYLKTCRRRLYLNDSIGQYYVVTPVSVLDIFVHPECQHQGFGLLLFNNMLEYEKIENLGEKCAFDRPSNSLLQFLEKNFQLVNPVWQPTNMVVYPAFFNAHEPNANPLADLNETRNLEEERRRAKIVYDGTPSSVFSTQSARGKQRDSISDVIHFGDRQLPTGEHSLPDTPRGRKHTRDFGHTNIW